MKELVRYLLVGVGNTCVGFGIIFVLMFVGVLPELANFIGYAVGIVFSYFLNRTFTFKSKREGDFILFVLSMLMAYLLNLATLMIAFRGFGINEYFSQILAGGIYTLSGFLLSRFWVWRKDHR